MKTKITLLLLFIGLVANANFIQGTILFNDGHSETGFIDSFLENKFRIDPLGLNSLEHSLNLDDKTLKFKTTENDNMKIVNFDDINEITLFRGDLKQEFKILYLKDVDKKGGLVETNKKACLPLVKRGKVNIYGFIYKAQDYDPYTKSTSTHSEVAYYYQNEKENFAFNYYDFDIQDIFYFKQRFANPLKELFKDCPKLVTYVNNTLLEPENLTKEEKAKMKEDNKNMRKALKKEYKDLPKEVQNNNLDAYHKYKLNAWDELINRYNNNDCN